jgi:thiamine kinase-like enzyme
MNFWQFVTATDAAPDPRSIGTSLHQCHAILKSFDEPLPALAILHESLTILEQRAVIDALTPGDIVLLARHLQSSIETLRTCPQQALHGDAHMGNLLMTTHGLLWTDWEDAFAGPVEWDLASIIWNAKLLENDQATTDAIIQAYESCGTAIDHQVLHQCLVARAAVMSTWYPILYPQPSPQRLQKLRQRLDWLRTQRAYD